MQNWSQQDFMPAAFWQSTQVGSHLYGIPADTNFLFLFYRKDLFTQAGIPTDQPPATWADLEADAKKLTHRADGRYGLGLIPKTWYFHGISRISFGRPAGKWSAWRTESPERLLRKPRRFRPCSSGRTSDSRTMFSNPIF
jgi:ABC-type glycerol-3-phosphate transport system substrate-binding protein